MSVRQKLLAVTIAGLLAPGLAACATVDAFSDRAVDYNLEAEQAQEQALLLNVVRAIKRRPMQFTSLQTVTGQAVAGETGGVSFPFGHHPNTNAQRVFTLGESVSGGPQFVVPILDTQEFYNGLMRPISPQIIDLYIEARFPMEEVFDLMLHKFALGIAEKQFNCIVKRAKASKTRGEIVKDLYKATDDGDVEFVNYPSDALSFALFQSMLEHLIDDHGLTTGKIETKTKLGPAVKGSLLATQLGQIARETDDKIKVEKQEEAEEDCPPTPAEEANPDAAASDDAASNFAVVRTETTYTFCFEAHPEQESGDLDQDALEAEHAVQAHCKPDAKTGGSPSVARPEHTYKDLLELARLIDAYCDPQTKPVAACAALPRSKTPMGYPPEKGSCENALKHQKPVVTRDTVKPDLELVKDVHPQFEPQMNGKITFACYHYVFRVWNQYLAAAHALLAFPDKRMPYPPLSIVFYPRSTEGAIYYLGEVARQYNDNLDALKQGHQVDYSTAKIKFPLVGVFKVPPSGEMYRSVTCEINALEPNCRNFFRVETGSEITGGPVSVVYDAERYAVADAHCEDPDKGCDFSAPTLELVKQLLALNTSAKELPATTVLTVIGAP